MTVTNGDTKQNTKKDEDIVESLDFAFEIPCDGSKVGEDCDHAAEYKVHMVCCGNVSLLCEECMLWIMSVAKRARVKRVCLQCLICNGHSHRNNYESVKYDGPIK